MCQPNLGIQDDQEDIVSSLNTFVWRHRRNVKHYRNTSQVLEEEERRVEALERSIQRRNIQKKKDNWGKTLGDKHNLASKKILGSSKVPRNKVGNTLSSISL